MIGQTISHYKILERLGEGGMGVVYKATDLNLDRSVALKFLPPELTRDPGAKARFVHEAKAASALDHPNVCTVYEVNETDNGQLFMAMACYEGETLKERIARGLLKLDDALTVASQIAEGLAAAHGKDIVHRDIKPANIFITNDGLVKILDFGLAKLAGQTKITQEGTTLGTVAYMSPEQSRGEETDSRTDLWSLGVVLYEMTAGNPPFMGEGQIAVINSLQTREPEPLTGLRTGVPLDLERIIDKCLAKDAAERYQHAEDLLADIRVLQRQMGEQITAPGAASPILRKMSRRWPWVNGILAVAIVGGIVAVLVWWINGGDRADAGEYALAVVDFRDLQAPDDVLEPAGITELINIGLIENSPIRVVSPEYLQDLRRRMFGSGRGPIEDDQIIEVARRAGATFLLAGRISRTSEEQFITWRLVDTRNGESVEARKVEGNRLPAMVNQIVAGVLPAVARACGIVAKGTQVAVGRITTESSEAFDHYIEALLFRESGFPDKVRHELEKAVAVDSSFALAHLELGRLFQSTAARHRDEINAKFHLAKAESLIAHLGTKDRLRLKAARYHQQNHVSKSIATYEEIRNQWPDDREALTELMWLCWQYWDFRTAGLIAQEGLELYPDDYQDFIQAHFDMLMMTGHPLDALVTSREYAARDPDDPRIWLLVARAWLASGEPDSAVAAHQKAADIEPTYWNPEWAYWYAYFSGELNEAISLLEQRLDDDSQVDSSRFWLMAVSTVSPGLSTLYFERGQYKKMLETVDEALQYSHGNRANWAFNKSIALLSAGRVQEALELAVELSDRYDDLAVQWLGLRIRARALVALGDLGAAREAVDELYAAQERYGGMARTLALKVEAYIALTENEPDKALESLDSMIEQGVPVFGLFDIEYREARARAHQMAGRLVEAANVYEELLLLYRGHAVSRYELGKIYEQMGRADRAEEEYTIFLDMWSEADEGLPQLVDGRTRLAALKAAQ